MTTDDKINICVLIAVLIFCATVFPAALRQDDDAAYGRMIRQTFGEHR